MTAGAERQEERMNTGLEMKYFVLKPKGTSPYHAASRAAMEAYANAIYSTNRELAEDLIKWTTRETLASAQVSCAMSLRDWFAGMALAEVPDPITEADAPATARLAYAIADAMLIERAALASAQGGE